MKKILEFIKKKWILDTTKACILIALLIISFLGINIGVSKLNIPDIDLTPDKLYSLSDDTKNAIKDVKLNISIYFFGIEDNNPAYNLAKQYNRYNEKITTSIVNYTQNPDLFTTYNISVNDRKVVIKSPERYKVLNVDEFTQYNYTTSKYMDFTEQELTNAILDTTIAKKQKIYYLSGHNNITNINNLIETLSNQVYTIESLDLNTVDEFPKDCDLLYIIEPKNDFSQSETTKITNYIQNGGNILWLSSKIYDSCPNIQSILALYGASIPNGKVRESNLYNTIYKIPDYYAPSLVSHTTTKSLMSADTSSPLMALFDSSKIDTVSDEELLKLHTTALPFIKSSSTSYFRTDLSNTSTSATETEEKGPFNQGIEFEKYINDVSSKLILISDFTFVTDSLTIAYESSIVDTVVPFEYCYNKEILLNITNYLSGKDKGVSIIKSDNAVTYNASETENTVVLIIIFALPLIIIISGIIVWIIRRTKK